MTVTRGEMSKRGCYSPWEFLEAPQSVFFWSPSWSAEPFPPK